MKSRNLIVFSVLYNKAFGKIQWELLPARQTVFHAAICGGIFRLFEITQVLVRDFFLVHLEELDENPIGRRHHDIFPDSEVLDSVFELHPIFLEPVHNRFNIVCLDADVMDASSAGVFRSLAVKVYPAGADAHEHVSRTGDQVVENDLAAEALPVKGDAFIDIGCKNMNVVEMVDHFASFPVRRVSSLEGLEKRPSLEI